MSFMLSPRWFALDSRRSPRRLRAKERRRNRLALLVTPLEERQLLTTPTLISVSASASSLVFGQAEVLTATVQSNPPGTNVPTGGTVTFENGSTVLGTASLANGSASLSTVLPAGTYSVTATYGGTATLRRQHEHDIRRLHLRPGRQRHLREHRHPRRCGGDVGRAGQPLRRGRGPRRDHLHRRYLQQRDRRRQPQYGRHPRRRGQRHRRLCRWPGLERRVLRPSRAGVRHPVGRAVHRRSRQQRRSAS